MPEGYVLDARRGLEERENGGRVGGGGKRGSTLARASERHLGRVLL
jgi:hypothetical protein